jgi:hypothetical protein
MSLKSTSITVTVNGGEEKPLGSGSVLASFPATNPLYNAQTALTDGTGTNKAQKVGLASFSLTGGASATFDLTAFPGPFGNVNFSLVKECIIDNKSTDVTNILEVGDEGTTTNPWTSMFSGTNARVKLHPGSAPLRFGSPLVGFAASGGNKTLKVKNIGAGTNAASGNVLMIGEGT